MFVHCGYISVLTSCVRTHHDPNQNLERHLIHNIFNRDTEGVICIVLKLLKRVEVAIISILYSTQSHRKT
jgi:hypothetical protein